MIRNVTWMAGGIAIAIVVMAVPAAQAATAERGMEQAATSLRVGCINFAYIAANSKQGKQAAGELQSFTQKKQGELDARAKALGAQEARLKSEAAALAEPARLELERTVRKAQLEFARFREDSQSEVQQFAEKVEQELRARLFPVVDAISKEKGLALIFAVDAPGLVWFSSTLDVSQDVVDRLDRAPQ